MHTSSLVGSYRSPFKNLLTLTIGWYLITSPVTVLANSPVEILKNTSSTKVFHMIPEDTVSIDGEIYKIPMPWQGNRLTVGELTFEDFALIPTDSAYQESKLYMLKDAQQALVVMIEKAKEDGVTLIVHSAYRSKEYQHNIFRKMMAEGRTFDDVIRYVAPPGYSEHMLGTVVDFYPSNWNFAAQDSYTWLQENGWRFSFSESYPKRGKPGEPWEPWHWRYIPENDPDLPQKKTEEQ